MNSPASLVQWSLSTIVIAVDINTASSNEVGYDLKVATTAVT
jgi:hypothetical protein